MSAAVDWACPECDRVIALPDIGAVETVSEDAGAAPERDLLPHERVRLWRVPDSSLDSRLTAEPPVVVCPMTEVAIPVPAKRGDAFSAGSKLVRLADENGWEFRATYTRIRHPAHGQRRARYVATMAVRLRRASIWPWRFERMVAYYRTNAKGAYGFAWAAVWLVDRDRVLVAPQRVSAEGLRAALAVPVGLSTAGWAEAIAPWALDADEDAGADADDEPDADESGMSDGTATVPSMSTASERGRSWP